MFPIMVLKTEITSPPFTTPKRPPNTLSLEEKKTEVTSPPLTTPKRPPNTLSLEEKKTEVTSPPLTTPKRPPNTLSLEDKVALIQDSETNGRSQRQLAQKFNIGKTQVSSILKRKKRYLDAFENNVPTNRKRIISNVTYDEVDKITWEWFQCKRAKFYNVNGPLLKAQAKKIASELGYNDFKASNGWLFSFKQRHNICSSIASTENEKSTVYIETVQGFKTQLCHITVGYQPRDIFNLDETSILFRTLPCRSLVTCQDDFADGKRPKDRITVCLAVNMLGEFDKPIVIGRHALPLSFRNLTMDKLPVHWHSNTKAWMTSSVFDTWLNDFNSRMNSQGRNVLLFLDNAFSHSHQANGLSNVRLVISPTDKTSILHPLEKGIIQNIKMHYRRLLLSHVLTTQTNGTKNLLEISKLINVLNACEWVATAVKCVKRETVQRGFRMAGFNEAFLCRADEVDELSSTSAQLGSLMQQVAGQLPEPIFDPHEYASIDASVPCAEELLDNWEENLVSEWLSSNKGRTILAVKEDIDDESEEEFDLTPTAITSLKQALQSARDQKEFAIEMGLDNIYRLAVAMEAEYLGLLSPASIDVKPNFLGLPPS